MVIITKACANLECRHQLESQCIPGDNPYDSVCGQCKSRVCLLCGSFTHFPATCKERERWRNKGVYRVGDENQKKLHKWGEKVFKEVEEELRYLKTWRLEYGPEQHKSPYRRIGAAFDEMEQIMRLWRWVAVIACCNTRLVDATVTHFTELQKQYNDLKKAIPLPQMLPKTELFHLDTARYKASRAVRNLLSMLLNAKSGSRTVVVEGPSGHTCVGFITSDHVDTTVVPDCAGPAPDEGVDWKELMKDAIIFWGGAN